MLKVKVLSSLARVPERKTKGSAGFDLFSTETLYIRHGIPSVIGTGVALSFPEGHYGRVTGRSGNTSQGLLVQTGVIDPDYTGEIKVIVTNINETCYYPIQEGDAIAQIICEKFSSPDIEIVQEFAKTERGNKGFGSTGLRKLTNQADNTRIAPFDVKELYRKDKETYQNDKDPYFIEEEEEELIKKWDLNVLPVKRKVSFEENCACGTENFCVFHEECSQTF
jgi:dUTP pyrophosphatase